MIVRRSWVGRAAASHRGNPFGPPAWAATRPVGRRHGVPSLSYKRPAQARRRGARPRIRSPYGLSARYPVFRSETQGVPDIVPPEMPSSDYMILRYYDTLVCVVVVVNLAIGRDERFSNSSTVVFRCQQRAGLSAMAPRRDAGYCRCWHEFLCCSTVLFCRLDRPVITARSECRLRVSLASAGRTEGNGVICQPGSVSSRDGTTLPSQRCCLDSAGFEEIKKQTECLAVRRLAAPQLNPSCNARSSATRTRLLLPRLRIDIARSSTRVPAPGTRQ